MGKPLTFYIQVEAINLMLHKHHVIVNNVHIKRDTTALAEPGQWKKVVEVDASGRWLTPQDIRDTWDELDTREGFISKLFGVSKPLGGG